MCGNKSKWQKWGQSGETETWQPTKTEKRNGLHKTQTKTKTEGKQKAIERKATTAPKRSRKVHLETWQWETAAE